MKKIKIGEEHSLKMSYAHNCKSKVKAFNSLLEFVKSNLSTVNEKELATNPRTYFENTFYNECGSPKYLTPQEVLISSSVDRLTFDKLVSNYLRIPVKFDGVNFEDKDFNIYATNDKQVNLYEKTNNLCKAINEIIDLGYMVAPGLLSNGMHGIIIANYSDFPHLIPNPHFITQVK